MKAHALTEEEISHITRNMCSSMKLAVKSMLMSENGLSIESVAHRWQVSVSGLKKAMQRFR